MSTQVVNFYEKEKMNIYLKAKKKKMCKVKKKLKENRALPPGEKTFIALRKIKGKIKKKS